MLVPRLFLKKLKLLSDSKSTQFVNIFVVDRQGNKKSYQANRNEDFMTFSRRFPEIEVEGACEGSCACSTCHVYIEDKYYARLPPASEEEDDMLDMAPGLAANSRLGCQVVIDESFEGATFTLPRITRNFYVDKKG